MTGEPIGKAPEPRDLGKLGPQEFDTFLAVPAWNVWESNPFDGLHSKHSVYEGILADIKTKPLALAVTYQSKGYEYVHKKVIAVPGRVGEPVIPSTYYLEPSNEEEAKVLQERQIRGINFEPETSLSSHELRQILTR